MYKANDYLGRGLTFLHNQLVPKNKKLATLAIFGTDLCDSACKHCLIWTKRPANYLPFEKIKELVSNKCVNKKTKIALAGGEFLLHPNAIDIMSWFKKSHPKFDLLSNALNPELIVEAVEKNTPNQLYISLDGDSDTYKSMRGKDGYNGIIGVLEKLHRKLPISLMFTLSPFNDFDDLEHVALVCKKFNIDLRIGIYNNISFFDTIENAHNNEFGSLKGTKALTFKSARNLVGTKQTSTSGKKELLSIKNSIPDIIKEFPENYDYLVLYDEWRQGNLKLNCHSILDSIVILPNGDVPICQNLDVLLGNIHTNTLDEILRLPDNIKKQNHYVKNCNACWINFHRKYDIALYRNFERFFGKFATSQLLGYYWWDKEKKKTYKEMLRAK